jgi:prolipoprotein diacylglyceryltransferase
MPAYFISNLDPELLSIGKFILRWDALLLILGFLLGRRLLLFLYRKNNTPFTISALSLYLVISALIGSRLFHVLLYDLESLKKFYTIFLPFGFDPSFSVLPRNEFSVHGAVIGILTFILLYRKKLGETSLQALDKITLPCVVAGIFICVGGFISAHISGKQTVSRIGVVYLNPVQKGLLKVPCCIMRSPDGKNPLQQVVIKKHPAFAKSRTSQPPLLVYLFFNPGLSEQLVNEFLVGDVKTFLYDMSPYVHEPGTQPLQYQIFLQPDGRYIARIVTRGIARFPVQFMEVFALLALLIVLYRGWMKHPGKFPGKLFGTFMILFWSFHLMLEVLRVDDKTRLLGFINPALVLDTIFVSVGIVSLYLAWRKMLSLQR